MSNNIKKLIFYSIFVLFASLILVAKASSGTLSLSGYGWSNMDDSATATDERTIGWVSTNCTDPGNDCGVSSYNVNIDSISGKFSGYAYYDMNDPNTAVNETGWISFNRADTGSPPSNDPCPDGTCTAKVDNPAGLGNSTVNVIGWARALAGGTAESGGWDGWIRFDHGSSNQAAINSSGNFSGYVWSSEVIGWIDFSGVSLDLAPVPTLSVSLSASPSSGNPPLTSTLTATVFGTAVGTINYKFDCTNDGVYEGIFNNVSDNPKTYSCVYNTVGTYTARVYVERDIAPSAENTATITVTAPAVPVAPTGLVAVAGIGADCEKINLSWTDNSNNETKFEIERKAGVGVFAKIAEVGANITVYQNLGLTVGVNYTYRVRACNGAGCSVYTNQSSAVAAACAAIPTYTLAKDGDIFATIIGGTDTVSSKAIIKVVADPGFTDDVVLSVVSVAPFNPGFGFNFSDNTLSQAEYGNGTGSEFKVNVPGATPEAVYTITVQGDSNGLLSPVIVKLNVTSANDDWWQW